jgi:hypothetical protein
MKVKELSFGTINIDGKNYSKDIVIHKGIIKKRKKKESKKFRSQFGHTPLSFLKISPGTPKSLSSEPATAPPYR